MVQHAHGGFYWIGLTDEDGEWEWVNKTPYVIDRRWVDTLGCFYDIMKWKKKSYVYFKHKGGGNQVNLTAGPTMVWALVTRTVLTFTTMGASTTSTATAEWTSSVNDTQELKSDGLSPDQLTVEQTPLKILNPEKRRREFGFLFVMSLLFKITQKWLFLKVQVKVY